MTTISFSSKTEAIAAARAARAAGKTARTLRKASTFTVPGRGITAHIEYVVEISNCLAHNGTGQDIHDYDIAKGRPCSLCQSTAPVMTDAEIMAEEARIVRAEAR